MPLWAQHLELMLDLFQHQSKGRRSHLDSRLVYETLKVRATAFVSPLSVCRPTCTNVCQRSLTFQLLRKDTEGLCKLSQRLTPRRCPPRLNSDNRELRYICDLSKPLKA